MFKETIGIILAGTHPWSHSGVDSLLPRTLLPVAHRPLIWYGLAWLHREGIREVAVCGNRETRVLQSRLERHVPAGTRVSYHEDPMPRGAAGSASDAAIASDGETFVIAEGTSIPNVDLKALLEKHRTSGACVTVVVHSETRGHLAAVQVPNGIYVFDRRAFDSVPVHGFCDIKETLIPQLYAAGERIIPYEATAATPRVLDAASYMAVNEWMVDHLVRIGEERDGYVKGPNGLVHRDAYIAPDAVIVGPVLIGPGARVLAGAVVVGPTSIGREATLEAGSMVSRSAVWRRATIGGHASADRCLVGDDAVIEEGSHTVSEIISAGRSDVATDWVAQQSVAAARRPAFEVGARIARFVLGASWSGSPAAQ